VIGLPLAHWLNTTRTRLAPFLETLVTLPVVLPPTVIGFYVLVGLSPQHPPGSWWRDLTGQPLVFTFTGLVVASVFYSLPFAVQPLQHAFESIGPRPMEVAATLGARPVDAFFTVALPMASGGLATAGILTFAHTVGEFGLVLMLGGNIEGKTRVVSTQIYGHVEAMEYAQAHGLAALMVVFSFVVLLGLALLKRRHVRLLP
jgi:molybdate transport system permease protein